MAAAESMQLIRDRALKQCACAGGAPEDIALEDTWDYCEFSVRSTPSAGPNIASVT